MKFLTHVTDAKALRPWVYLDKSTEANPGMDVDALPLVGNLQSGSPETAPLNASLSGTINATRVGVENATTAAENQDILTSRAAEIALARQREAGYLNNPVETVRKGKIPTFINISDTFNMTPPTEALIFDKVNLSQYDPKSLLFGTLFSKNAIAQAFKFNLDSAIAMNADSPLIHSQLMYHFSKHNLEKTIGGWGGVTGGRREGMSLAMLDTFEQALDKFAPAAGKDFDDFSSELVQRLQEEESWKKVARVILPPAWRWPLRLKAKWLGRQLKQGIKQLKANIKSAREQQSRFVENTKARVDVFINGAQERGDTDSQENFWLLVTDVIQNPGEFLDSPKTSYYGINWRSVFGCARGKDGAITFLDTINKYYTNQVLDLPAIQIGHKVNMEAMDTIKTRHKEQQAVYGSTIFTELRSEVNELEIERAADIPKGPGGTLATVNKLTVGLGSHPLNLNVEAEVFKNKGASINRSPMERFALIAQYLLANKQLLNSKNPAQSLNPEAISYLKGYLFVWEDRIGARLESRSTEEASTPFARAQMILMAEGIVNEAKVIVNESIPELATTIGSDDRAKVDAVLNRLESLPTNIKALEDLLGDPADPASVISQVTQSERETLLGTIKSLKTLGETISSNADKIQGARKEYAKLMAIPDEPYREAKKKSVEKGEKAAAEVLDKSEGGLSIKGGAGMLAGFGDVGEGAGAAAAAATAEGGESGGSSAPGAGLETSFTTFMRYIRDVYNDINAWESKLGEQKGFSFPMADDLRPSANPMLDALTIGLNTRKSEIGIDKLTVENPNRVNYDEGLQLEMALETHKSMEGFAEGILQNYQTQQWDRINKKPVGFKLDTVMFADTTNQTETNALNAVLHPDPALVNVRLIPTPKEEANPQEVLYAEAEDTSGKKWWVKMVSPRLTNGADNTNLFLFERGGNMEQFTNPFQLLPTKKGVILSTGAANDTLRNNKYYESLWGKSA